MEVILLSSPLQPQSDTKVIPDKKATLTGGFYWQIQCWKCITNEK